MEISQDLAELIPVILVVGGGYLLYRYNSAEDKKRASALASFLDSHDLTFKPGTDNTGILATLRGVPFESGDSRYISGVFSGEVGGLPCEVFDYTYLVESRDSDGKPIDVHHAFKVATISFSADFPLLEIRPENALARIDNLINGTDINFEDEDFNRAFVVTSDDRKFAYDVMHPQMMEFFKSSVTQSSAAAKIARVVNPSLLGSTVTIHGNRILLVERGKLTPAEIVPALEHLASVLELMPQFVIASHSSRNS